MGLLQVFEIILFGLNPLRELQLPILKTSGLFVFLLPYLFFGIQGDRTNNTLTCLEDGLWSFPEALCELRCPAPPPVPNAVLQTKRCNETGLKVGTLCKYKCKPGYHVTSKPKRRAFKRQCTEDGSWLEGACEPVTCDPPPPIFHGSYHCTDGFRFDSVCKLNCSDPAGNTAIAGGGSAHTVRLLHAPCKQGAGSNVIRCRKDGNWTGSFRLCPHSKGQCSLPQNLHYSLQYSCKRGHGIGEECELTCRESNNDVVILPSNMTVESVLKEHWRNPHKVKSHTESAAFCGGCREREVARATWT